MARKSGAKTSFRKVVNTSRSNGLFLPALFFRVTILSCRFCNVTFRFITAGCHADLRERPRSLPILLPLILRLESRVGRLTVRVMRWPSRSRPSPLRFSVGPPMMVETFSFSWLVVMLLPVTTPPMGRNSGDGGLGILRKSDTGDWCLLRLQEAAWPWLVPRRRVRSMPST